MTREEACERLSKVIQKDGYVDVAYKLRCSVSQLYLISRGKRKPNLHLACLIESLYSIPVQIWDKHINGHL